MKIAIWIVSIVAVISTGVTIWLLIDKHKNKKPADNKPAGGAGTPKPTPVQVVATENAAGAAAVARYGL